MGMLVGRALRPLQPKRHAARCGIASIKSAALNNAQSGGAIGHGAPVRANRILRMRNWHDTGAASEANRRLNCSDPVGVSRANNAAIGFTAKGDGGKVR